MILIKQKPTYIRTKEHIYKRFFIDQAIMNECGYGHFDKELNPVGETIIKESDNLEELCDTKVAIRKSNHKPYLGHLSGIFYFQEDSGWLGRIDSYENIFGSIWVIDENGIPTLKPVAKMNDKGELELL